MLINRALGIRDVDLAREHVEKLKEQMFGVK